jgi:hypothetical protein
MGAEMYFLRRARRLTPQERRVLCATWLALAAAPLALALVPFRTLLDWAAREPIGPRRADAVAPGRVAVLVEAAARYHLVRATCLARALVLCRLLRRRGERARLVIGGSRGGGTNTPGDFEAHAWVACDGLALTAGGPIKRFTIFRAWPSGNSGARDGGCPGRSDARSPLTHA